jgi:hypothetical protein
MGREWKKPPVGMYRYIHIIKCTEDRPEGRV